MTSAVTTGEKLLQKRKFYIRSLIIFTVLLLFAFNLGSWLFLKQMDRYLENELEKRLTSIARLADRIILNNYINDLLSNNEPEFALFYIRQDLNKLIDNQELQAAFIIDRNFQVLVEGGEISCSKPIEPIWNRIVWQSNRHGWGRLQLHRFILLKGIGLKMFMRH